METALGPSLLLEKRGRMLTDAQAIMTFDPGMTFSLDERPPKRRGGLHLVFTFKCGFLETADWPEFRIRLK